MPEPTPQRDGESPRPKRRRYTKEFKEEVVQTLLDDHSATSITERLGLSGANLVYRWKRDLIGEAGRTASTLDQRVRELEAELRRMERAALRLNSAGVTSSAA